MRRRFRNTTDSHARGRSALPRWLLERGDRGILEEIVGASRVVHERPREGAHALELAQHGLGIHDRDNAAGSPRLMIARAVGRRPAAGKRRPRRYPTNL